MPHLSLEGIKLRYSASCVLSGTSNGQNDSYSQMVCKFTLGWSGNIFYFILTVEQKSQDFVLQNLDKSSLKSKGGPLIGLWYILHDPGDVSI